MKIHFYFDFYESHFLPLWVRIRVFYYQWGKVPQFLVLNIARFLIGLAQILTWRVSGVHNHLIQIRKKIRSEDADLLEVESAQIFKVWSTCKPSPFDKVRRCSYLTTHEKFCRPDFILSDKVVLTELTKEKAVYVQLKRTIDQYTVEKEPFFYNALVNDAEFLIEMPLKIFQQLANSITGGLLAGQWEHVTFLFNGGRCGSTVIARMVQEADLENTLVLSEPPVFIDFVWYKKLMSEDWFRMNMRCALAVFLKPMCNRRKVVIKLTYFIGCIAEDFHHALPSARYIYSYRDPLRMILAHERAFGSSPICLFLLIILRFDLWMWALRVMGLHSREHVAKVINQYLKPTMFDVCLIVWADGLRRYMEQSTGFYYPSLSYDDLLLSPTDFCRKLLQLVDLPVDRLEAALAALAKDSQEATVLSRNLLRHLPLTPCTPQLKYRADKFCDALNLPRLNFDFKKHTKNGLIKSEINGFCSVNVHKKKIDGSQSGQVNSINEVANSNK